MRSPSSERRISAARGSSATSSLAVALARTVPSAPICSILISSPAALRLTPSRSDRPAGPDQLDTHIGSCGRPLAQMDSQVADLVGRQAPFRRPVGPPLREGAALRDPADAGDASSTRQVYRV